MTNATLYINDVPLGRVTIDLPEPARPEPLKLSGSFSWSGRLTYRNGKRRRRDMRWLRELDMSANNRRYVRHYRAVKAHQLRKRQLTKRS